MWFIFGVIAIMATVVNLFLYVQKKDYRLAMVLALSFTALTVVADYGMIAKWVAAEDWAALLDVVPTMTMLFTVLTVISIIVNISPLLLDLKNNK